MDLSVNEALKGYPKFQFQAWYVKEVCCQVQEGCVQH